jgi:hypothetical protein
MNMFILSPARSRTATSTPPSTCPAALSPPSTSADAGVRFTPDGTMAYAPVGRNFNHDVDAHCYVYAFDTSVSGSGGDGGGDGPGRSMIFHDSFESGDETTWTTMVH